MFLRYLLLSTLLITSLSGCLSKIPQEVALQNLELTEENSQVVTDDAQTFSLSIPSNHELFLIDEQDDAQLYRISASENDPVGMTAEVYTLSIEEALDNVLTQGELQVLSRTDLEINGLQATRLSLEIPAFEGVAIPFYFVTDGERTFILRLQNDSQYDYFEAVVNSLQVT